MIEFLLVMLVCGVIVCNAQTSPAPSDLAGTWIGVLSNPDAPHKVTMAKLEISSDGSSANMDHVVVVEDYDSKIYTLYHRYGTMNLTREEGRGAGEETGYSVITAVWKTVSFRKDTDAESPIYPKDSWGTLANQILVLSIQWPDGAFDKIAFYKANGPNGLNVAKQALQALDTYIATTRNVATEASSEAADSFSDANHYQWNGGQPGDEQNYKDAISDEHKEEKEARAASGLCDLAHQYRNTWSTLIN